MSALVTRPSATGTRRVVAGIAEYFEPGRMVADLFCDRVRLVVAH